jgi:hypothetical protein
MLGLLGVGGRSSKTGSQDEVRNYRTSELTCAYNDLLRLEESGGDRRRFDWRIAFGRTCRIVRRHIVGRRRRFGIAGGERDIGIHRGWRRRMQMQGRSATCAEQNHCYLHDGAPDFRKPPFAIRMPLALVPEIYGADRVERLLLGQGMRAVLSGDSRRHITANTTH